MAPRFLTSFSVALALAVVGLGNGSSGEIPQDTLPAGLSVDSVPLGLDIRPISKTNGITLARVKLGRRLFFDPILSADTRVACASCHLPDHGFASVGRPRGINGQESARRAPTLFNRAYGGTFFWDGRADTLEDQALRPIVDAREMGSTLPEVIKRLSTDLGYKAQFAAAFPDGLTTTNLGKAIASFERVLLRGDSAVDRFRRRGDHEALTTPERHGLWLYESKARCWSCHGGANFSDEKYHNTGVGWGKLPLDLGRFTVTGRDADRGKFKTPTLRGVRLTAPYMHDASVKTLDDVVDFYNQGGNANPFRDPILTPLGLTRDEKADLVAFLKAL